jgi:acetyltransferase-like isoleucine patch superfamily enzyme
MRGPTRTPDSTLDHRGVTPGRGASYDEYMAFRRMVGRAAIGGYRLAQRVYGKSFSLLAGGAFASFGARSVLQPPIRLVGEGSIAIGKDVWVGPGSWLQSLSPDPGIALTIGDGTSIAGNVVISAARSIRLGQKVLLARGVYISDHIHRYDDTSRPILEQGIERMEPVEIGDGAWLGENVVICPGVRVGRGAVVGANAVVTEDVPDWSLAVGAPARVVRRFGAAPVAAVSQ